MKTEWLDNAAYVRTVHAWFYAMAQEQREKLRTTRDLQELADFAFTMRECVQFYDECHKEAKRLLDLVTSIVCVSWLAEVTSGKNPKAEPIRTEFCTVSPSIRMAPTIPHPKKQPEAYAALMNGLGIPDTLWQSDVVRPHWPGLVEHVTATVSAGLPLPPGVDVNATSPVYALSIRGKIKGTPKHE